MDLVTGHAGTEHISSADIAALLRGLYGSTDCVLVGDDQLDCTILDSNTVQIGTGGCLIQGHYARIDIAEELAVESGSVGYYRNDLVVIRYSLGASGVQSVALAIKQGDATTGAATDPTIASGSIDNGDATVEFALWRLPISGVNIGTPVRMMPVSTPFLTRGAALSSDGTSITADGTIQGATIADSVGTLAALRDSVSHDVANGLTVHELAGWAVVRFAGYQVSVAGIGAAGSIGFAPALPVVAPVSVEGVSVGFMSVLQDGTMTLYSADMGSYLTGTVHGSVIVPLR